jgi:hypothetical protein
LSTEVHPLIRLIPGSKHFPKGSAAVWDFQSFAVLARQILEDSVIFSHLIEPGLLADLLDFRQTVCESAKEKSKIASCTDTLRVLPDPVGTKVSFIDDRSPLTSSLRPARSVLLRALAGRVGNLLFADLVSHALGGCYPGIRPILPIRQKSRSILLKSVATILLGFFLGSPSPKLNRPARDQKTCKSVQPRVQKEQLFWPSTGPMHRCDSYFPNSTQFDPDRWLDLRIPTSSAQVCLLSIWWRAEIMHWGGFCLDGTGVVLTEISRR